MANDSKEVEKRRDDAFRRALSTPPKPKQEIGEGETRTEKGEARQVRRAFFEAMANVFSGAERIYPGSHELRPLALIPLESPLAPEGILVVASVEKSQAPLDRRLAYSPAQTLEQLTEVADAIYRQVSQAKQVLAKLGHPLR